MAQRRISFQHASVAVDGQQHQLKEQEASNPYGRSATEQRQHHFSNHRLKPKEQKCAQEQGWTEENDDVPEPACFDGCLQINYGSHATNAFSIFRPTVSETLSGVD